MWTVVVTAGATEFAVAERLRHAELEVFLPYTLEKARVRLPRRGRHMYKVVNTQIPRWPRYLFAKVPSTEALALVKATRDVHYLVKGAEGLTALLSDEAMKRITENCDASGRVTQLHRFSVGDLLRFVAGSNFAGRSALVMNIESNGAVRVMVDAHIKATVNYKDLAA